MKVLRLLLIFLSLMLLSFLSHIWIYGSTFVAQSMSDSLFVTGMLALLPTIIAMSSSYKVFQGFNYAFRSFLSPSFRQTYPKYSDFRSEKEAKIKTSVFLEVFIASAILVVAAILLVVV